MKTNDKLEFQMAQHPRFLETVIQEAKDGILVVNQEGFVQFANPAAQQLFLPEVKNLVGYKLGIPAGEERVEMRLSEGGHRVLELKVSELNVEEHSAYLVMARDITQQAGLKESLLEYQRLLEVTGETARVGGWEMNYEDSSVWLSDITCQILEVSRQDDLGLPEILKLFPREVRSQVEQAMNALLAQCEPYDLEVPCRTAKGKSLWVHISGRADEFDQGQCSRAWGTIQDITEKKETQLQLEAGEIFHQQVFDRAINGFVLVEVVRNEDGKIVDFTLLTINKAFEELLGVDKKTALGHSALNIIPGVLNTTLWDVFSKVAETGEASGTELYAEAYDRHFSLSIYAPAPNQLAIFFNDTTDQIKSDAALKQSERRYRQLFKHAMTGFALYEVVLDDEGEPIDLVFLEANDAFEEHTGLAPKDMIGRRVTEISPGTRIVGTFGRIALTGKAERMEYESADLKRTYFISAYSPEKGQVAAIFTDISEQITIAKELQKSVAQFRSLFETMAQGVVYHNAEGEVVAANPAAQHILGVPLEKMINESPIVEKYSLVKVNGDPLPGDQHPALVALRTGKSVENYIFGFYNPKRKDVVWLDASAIPQFRPGEDQPYQLFSTFLDITDTIRVQKALEERIKELRCLANVSRIIQEKHSLEAICQAVMGEIVPAMQYPESAVVKISIGGREFASGGLPSGRPNKLEAHIQIQDADYGSISVDYPDDKPFILPEELNLIESIAERLGLWYQQSETQKMLEESEHRFRNAIMEAPNPILIHAEDGEVITINDAWIESTGYTRDELKTLGNWLERAHPTNVQELTRIVSDSFRHAANTSPGEIPVLTKSGKELYWYFSSAPLGHLLDGRAILITVAIDITDRIIAEHETETYLNRIMALYEIDQMIGSTLDLDRVMDLITSQLGKLISFDSMAVLQVDGDNLVTIACQGFKDPQEVIGLAFPSLPEYPNYEVIQKKHPVTHKNISEAFPLFYQPVRQEVSGSIKTWLGVPLVVQDQVIGMFTIDRHAEEEYSKVDIEIAMQFASRAAIAITNARLYHQMKMNLDKLEILRKVDAAITSSLDFDDVLETVLGQVTTGLNVDIATIYLYDEATKMLKYARSVGFQSSGDTEISIGMSQGYVGRVASSQEPLFIPAVDLRSDGNAYPFSFKREGVTSYYGFPLVSKGKFQGVLELLNRTRLEPDEEWHSFAETLARQTAIAVDNLTLFANLQTANKELREAYDATIEGWAHALEIRDKETEGHSRRVERLTVEIARRYGFGEDKLVHIRRGVLLHDIGKMGIPDQILHKPGPLDEDEWKIMRKHPTYAYEMLKDIEYLRPALTIPHYHHERWNGAGYPEGLRGEEIPLEARIFAVVDAWDALTSDRPYRDAWSEEKAKQYLLEQAGIEFDPEVISVLLELINNP